MQKKEKTNIEIDFQGTLFKACLILKMVFFQKTQLIVMGLKEGVDGLLRSRELTLSFWERIWKKWGIRLPENLKKCFWKCQGKLKPEVLISAEVITKKSSNTTIVLRRLLNSLKKMFLKSMIWKNASLQMILPLQRTTFITCRSSPAIRSESLSMRKPSKPIDLFPLISIIFKYIFQKSFYININLRFKNPEKNIGSFPDPKSFLINFQCEYHDDYRRGPSWKHERGKTCPPCSRYLG